MNTHMKGAGMLVVSLRGVHFGVLVSLRVFTAKPHNIWPERSPLGLYSKKYKKYIFFNSFYLLNSCNQSLKWSLLGVKNRLVQAQIGLL